MSKIEARLYSGFRDRLPTEMNYRNYVTDKLRTVFEKYGFEPIETPAIERYEILTGKYGEDAENLIYRLDHKDRKTIALRYDLTVPLSRVIAMNSQIVRPIFKRYQIQQVWRGERPQKGRYREFTQCDVDVIGSSLMVIEAELLALVNEMMIDLGFTNFEILINNRKILSAMVNFAGVGDQLKNVCRSIDKLAKIGVENVKAELSKNAIPNDAIEKIFQVVEISGDNETVLIELESVLGDLGKEGVSELREIENYLRSLGVDQKNYRIDPSLARGLDYYTGPIFEVIVADAEIGSVLGGGRWDTLIEQYIGKEMPAVGVSFGLERLTDAMEILKILPETITKTQVLVIPFSIEMIDDGLKILSKLRSAGINSEIYAEPKSFRQTFGYADRKNIPIAVIVAPDEIERGEVAIRDMKTREQITRSIENFVDEIIAKLA